MNNTCKIPITVLVVFLTLNGMMFAQNQQASPLNPEFVRPERYGVQFGIGGVQQNGEYNVNCNCPGFKNGAGTGYLFAGLYELETRTPFIGGIAVGYHYRSFSAINNINNDTTFTSTDENTAFRNVPIQIKHQSEVSFSEVFLSPYVKVFPISQTFFFRLGGYVGFIASSSLNHTVALSQSTVQLENGQIVRISIDDKKITELGYKKLDDGRVLLEDGKIPNLNSLQFALLPAIGAEIRLSKLFMLVPTVQYNLPLTSISSSGSSYKVSSWQFLLELHYLLRKND